jgi:hypothetical protein
VIPWIRVPAPEALIRPFARRRRPLVARRIEERLAVEDHAEGGLRDPAADEFGSQGHAAERAGRRLVARGQVPRI